jgi:hypothetical protein
MSATGTPFGLFFVIKLSRKPADGERHTANYELLGGFT